MRSGNFRSFVVAALAAAGSVWATGCAQGVGTIDRTQAHRIDKSWLNDGKPWYFLQTVVDAPPTINFTFTGEASFPPDRIVWSVQENWLYAYKNYEFIVNSQAPYSTLDHGTAGGSQYFGAPVAAYTVTSHFDVQRDYNSATGEQTNVIEENTTDRPWYQRQYMHVDWSNNGLSNFNFMAVSFGLNLGDILTTPVAYYPDEEDPKNKDRAEITPNYIGIVNKMAYQAEYDQEASSYYGQNIYKCYLYVNQFGLGDCGPGEVKVRLSFKKIEDSHDFFPRNYNDKDVNLFGVWQQQRAVYNPARQYTYADLSHNQMAVMHHIWMKDHLATDPSTGVACDPRDFSNPNCEMPLNQRSPKPIVYYVSEDWPALADPNHKTMWLQAKLLADEYNDDMRGVVASARRGGVDVPADPNLMPPGGPAMFQAIEPYLASKGQTLVNADRISYKTDGRISYAGAQGLDYLAYPPDTRHLVFSPDGYDAVVRPNVTYTKDTGEICNAAEVAAGSCKTCDPSTSYCMGIGHLPYTVVPRMFLMCHNPVQPRVINQGDVLPDGSTYAGTTIDKTDPTSPDAYDFSKPGDPGLCDTRADADRKKAPLNPQLGDLRYHMLAWVPQPDTSAPGGIGEPAIDPVTGEIVSAHAYIYGRAVEGLATYGADLVAILNGWENVSDFIQGNMVRDYVIATQNRVPPIFSGQRLTDYVQSPPMVNKIQTLRTQVNNHLRDGDYAVDNWKRLLNFNDPRFSTTAPPDLLHAMAPEYGVNGGAPIPQAVQDQFSLVQLAAPDSVSTFNQDTVNTNRMFADRHILTQDEIEPTAVRLAQYYKERLVPGASTNPCSGDTTSPVYRTCVWNVARQEILGNLWRSYSDHEVGHTFGQYHNFAGSTDALNYFDPYWSIRQENTISVKAGSTNPNGAYLFQHLGAVPLTTLPDGTSDNAVLAPEFMQPPSAQSLSEGLREYQYTSIMDYNSKFNADFQGIGKYDHACHMYQYARQVEVFDPTQLPNVPKNTDTDRFNGQPTSPHQIAHAVLVPMDRHYTYYPWLINDGLNSEGPGGKVTPLAQGIQKMIHARKWVAYNDLMNGVDSDAQAQVNGFAKASDLNNATMVPYRFCSDQYEQGQAQCLQFDEGADAYEQAMGFINQYKLNYFFNNFKRGSTTFAPFDYAGSYLSRLWGRNFHLLTTIFQQAWNDEFIVRFDVNKCLDGTNQPTQHYAAAQCGIDRMAAQTTIADFFTKILQAPNTGQYGWVASHNTYCSTESGHCDYPGNPNVNDGVHPALTLQPGDDSRFDESQYDFARYGHLYMYEPLVMGTWFDKVYAIRALTDPYSNIIGTEGSKPFSYLLPMSSFFDHDAVGAIGGLFNNDPKWAPKVAYWSANPSDPAHPPLTLYQNSEALQATAQGNIGYPYNPFCPPGTSGLPGVPTCTPNPSYDTQFDHDPATLASLGYTVQPLNPGPVYYERTSAIIFAVAYLTTSVDDLKFMRTIKVNMKGSGTFDNSELEPLACDDGSVCNPGTPTCDDGSSCDPTHPCANFSACLPRKYACANNAPCNGVCVDGYKPSVTTCNPNRYAEYTDVQAGNTYFAVKYMPNNPQNFSNNPNYYSIAYELVKQVSDATNRGATPGSLSGVQLLDVLRSLYYFWSYDPYFAPN